MTENDLGNILKTMYNNAIVGNKVTAIHLFGIRYGEEISAKHLSVKNILKCAEMSKKYSTEIYKDMRLGHYVTIREDYLSHI